MGASHAPLLSLSAAGSLSSRSQTARDRVFTLAQEQVQHCAIGALDIACWSPEANS